MALEPLTATHFSRDFGNYVTLLCLKRFLRGFHF